jgi:hypothetical protein
MSQHTPGPWNQVGACVYPHSTAPKEPKVNGKRIPPLNYPICQLLQGHGEDEVAANARLIALAPDMLSFIRQCRDLIASRYDQSTLESWAKAIVQGADELLKKAEG